MPLWNPWHGCVKISPGCQNCYVYRRDALYQRDSSVAVLNSTFRLPLAKKRDGSYKVPAGTTLYTCFSSDFFLDQADVWRAEAWSMMDLRRDLHFYIITKRIDRFFVSLPSNWGNGYENVTICVTCEDQQRADERIPLLLSAPLRHREIICEPLLEPVDVSHALSTGQIEKVTAGGESGPQARVCDLQWIESLRWQCMTHQVPFFFKQTGARFCKDGPLYRIPRKDQHAQAKKSGLSYRPHRETKEFL